MAGLNQTRANAMLDTELTGTLQVRLFSVAPTATTAGTEISGSAYAPQTITFAASSAGTKAQSADVNFPACTTASYTIVAWAVTDGSGNQKVFRSFTAITVNIGDIVKFLVASNPITINLA
jgi:hypothetical protein